MWQSKAPMPIITSCRKPNVSAHCFEITPAGSADVYTLLKRRVVKPLSTGSSDAKNALGGSPFQVSLHNDLWPAAQTPRFISDAFVPPVKRKGIQSQCSTHE